MVVTPGVSNRLSLDTAISYFEEQAEIQKQTDYGENLTCFPNLIMKCTDSPLLDCKNYSGIWSANKSYQWMHENSNKILWKAKNNNWQIGDREDFEFDSSGIFAAGYSCPYDTTTWYKLVDGETWKEIPNFYIETQSKARCLKKSSL